MNTSFDALRRPCLCVALVLSAGLMACGDGGANGSSVSTGSDASASGSGSSGGSSNSGTTTTPTTTSNLTSASLQGRWLTDSSAATAYTVIALPNNASTSSTQAWALAQDGSGLAQLVIDNNSQVQGALYSLKSNASVAITGTVSLNASVTPKTLSLPGLSTANTVLTQSDALSGRAVLADIVGSWKGAVSDGTKTVTWTVSASTGELAGTSSTGCVYSGLLTPVDNLKVFTTVFSESCSDGSSAGYAGISTVSPDGTRLSTVAVANSRLGSQAIALLLSR